VKEILGDIVYVFLHAVQNHMRGNL